MNKNNCDYNTYIFKSDRKKKQQNNLKNNVMYVNVCIVR